MAIGEYLLSSIKKFSQIFINKLLRYEQYLFFVAEKIIFNPDNIKHKRHIYFLCFIGFLLILVGCMQLFQVNWSPLLYPILLLVGLFADRVTAYVVATIVPTITTFFYPFIHCVYNERQLKLTQKISAIHLSQPTVISLLIAIISYLVVIEICIIVKYIIEDGESDNKFLRTEFLNKFRKNSDLDSLDEDL